jgi:hypothetical protein
MKKQWKPITTEYCKNCDTEQDITATINPMPHCKKCKKQLVPCSACDIPSREGKKGLCTGCENGSKFVLHHDYTR